MLTIQDLAISKELDASETSTVRGGDGRNAPPCKAWDTDDVGYAACVAQDCWYQTFGFLLPK
jgi:hypothetical protein